MILNRHKSTISREISRHTGLRGYRPGQAQRLTEQRRQSKGQTSIPRRLWRQVARLPTKKMSWY